MEPTDEVPLAAGYEVLALGVASTFLLMDGRKLYPPLGVVLLPTDDLDTNLPPLDGVQAAKEDDLVNLAFSCNCLSAFVA